MGSCGVVWGRAGSCGGHAGVVLGAACSPVSVMCLECDVMSSPVWNESLVVARLDKMNLDQVILPQILNEETQY